MKTLETCRLILRTWEMDDLDDFYEYARNPNVGPMAGWEPHGSKEVSKKILESFIEKDEVWAIEYKANRKVIGSIGAHPDTKRQGIRVRMIGYVLSQDYWGQGIMTEAVKEVIRYLFKEEKYDVLSCYHYPFNKRSKRVIEKCGFVYEDTLRSASMIYDGTIHDVVSYSIKKEDYHQKFRRD
jgi:ribosomal-protein-alanine N-acetyltransferase